MKKYNLIFVFVFLTSSFLMANNTDPISLLVEESQEELKSIYNSYQDKKYNCITEISLLNKQISESKNSDDMFYFLIKKSEKEEELKTFGNEFRIKLAERRYRKGIELIRLLYEKILGLDYHFSDIQTNQSLMHMTNPNAYPEFKKMNSIMAKEIKKKNGFRMPEILQNNPYVASSFSIISAFFGEGSRREKEQNLEEIACILDFTIQMNTDLKIVFYETEYLKASNHTLKEDCMNLFNEYTKVIGYEVSLDKCRDSDDWDNVFLKLDEYISNMKALYEGTPEEVKLAYKKNASIEFPLNLMTAFINKYNNFIGQGKNYYRKFRIILENYQNKKKCDSIIPEKFKTLSIEIQNTVLKFDEAYNIAELKGSKLKDLLYGYDD